MLKAVLLDDDLILGGSLPKLTITVLDCDRKTLQTMSSKVAEEVKVGVHPVSPPASLIFIASIAI